MTDTIRSLLMELKAGLGSIYQDRLRGVYLYGSYARQEEDAESDLDVLIVLDRIEHYAKEVNRTGDLVSQLSLRYGVSVSRVFVGHADWTARGTAFLFNACAEAVPL